jgi:hypothetical protein
MEAALTAANVNLQEVSLHCIDSELESWLIADGRGLSAWLQAKTTHELTPFRGDATSAQPKNAIRNYIRQEFGKHTFNETYDCIHIFNALPDLDRAAKGNVSFAQLRDRISGLCA